GRGERLDPRCAGRGEVPWLLQAHPAQPRQLDGLGEDDESTGEAEAAQALLLGLALRIAELAFEFALPLQLATTEDAANGLVQIAQRLLRGTLAPIIHPRHNRLFERIQFAVQVNSGRTRAGLTVLLLLALQAPVVGPARRPCVLAARGHLRVVQVQ